MAAVLSLLPPWMYIYKTAWDCCFSSMKHWTSAQKQLLHPNHLIALMNVFNEYTIIPSVFGVCRLYSIQYVIWKNRQHNYNNNNMHLYITFQNTQSAWPSICLSPISAVAILLGAGDTVCVFLSVYVCVTVSTHSMLTSASGCYSNRLSRCISMSTFLSTWYSVVVSLCECMHACIYVCVSYKCSLSF